MNFLETIVHLTKEKAHFVNEFWDLSYFLFIAPDKYDEAVIAKRWNEKTKVFFESLINAYKETGYSTNTEAENILKATAEKAGIKTGEVMQLFRVLLTGQAQGPGLFEMAALLGRDETVRRLEHALKILS